MADLVLVPLDGSPISERAIPYATAIARATGRSLLLLTVWEGPGIELATSFPDLAKAMEQEGKQHYRRYLRDVAKQVSAQGVETHEEVRSGDAADELLAALERHEPDLLVMATHGRSGIHRLWYGSVASKLMRAAPVPTLLVGPRAPEDGQEPVAIREILVPLDGSPLSEAALEPAAALAGALGARLTLARAVPWAVQTFAFGLPESQAPQIDRELTAAADAYLMRARDQVKTERPVGVQVLRGQPAEALLDLIASKPIDLVVMAPHARAGVMRWALGSVADRLIGGAAPVLLVRPEFAGTVTRRPLLRARRCHHCGRIVPYVDIEPDARCLRCGQHLRACVNCVFYDGILCLLRRPEAADVYAGNRCPKFQFRETATVEREAG